MTEKTISSSDLLLLSLTKYYSNSKSNKINILKDIMDNNSKLSLRLIDWYVTNYCKHYNIAYILSKKNNKEIMYFNVYMNYRSQLKAFKKVLFDPFRRRSKIKFFYDDANFINTTIGQLNFFRWAIDNQIIHNLQMKLSEVEADMLKRQKADKPQKETTGDAKKTSPNGSTSTIPNGSTSTISNVKKKKKVQNNSIKTMTTFSGNTLISFI